MLVPLSNRILAVLAAPLDAEKTTASGIVLPTAARHTDTITATVIAVGNDVPPAEIAAGDTIVFAPYGFDQVRQGETDCILIAASLVLAREPRTPAPTDPS